MKRFLLDLGVTAAGAVTSVATAFFLFWVQQHSGIAIHAFSAWFVLPIGAVLSGIAAASGYALGARLMRYRPTGRLRLTGVLVAVGTYLLIYYFQYSSLTTSDGRPFAELVGFPAFLDLVWTHTRINLYGITTGAIGALGYVKAGLQVLGFIAGPLVVYGWTQSIPYCDACCRAPQRKETSTRYTTYPGDIEKTGKMVAAAIDLRRRELALAAFAHFGEDSFSAQRPFRSTMTLYECGSCRGEIVDYVSAKRTGGRWRRMGDLSFRKLLPA